MRDRIATFLFFVYFLLTCIVCVTGVALTRLFTQPFDRRLRAAHFAAGFWASLYVRKWTFWPLTLSGQEKVDPQGVYVIVSNHQSLVDILAGYQLPVPFKFVAKAELFRVPFIGWNLVLNRHIRLKRGDRQSIVDMMKAAGEHLARGSSVFIFPEGTRSETGEVQSFKTGAFALAKRAGVPILPVAILGSKNALPKGELVLHGRSPIHVEVLDPLPYEEFAEMDVKELTEQVQARIEAVVTSSPATA